jgi:hypothetical protein
MEILGLKFLVDQGRNKASGYFEDLVATSKA